jgi:hypothetical protein
VGKEGFERGRGQRSFVRILMSLPPRLKAWAVCVALVALCSVAILAASLEADGLVLDRCRSPVLVSPGAAWMWTQPRPRTAAGSIGGLAGLERVSTAAAVPVYCAWARAVVYSHPLSSSCRALGLFTEPAPDIDPHVLRSSEFAARQGVEDLEREGIMGLLEV